VTPARVERVVCLNAPPKKPDAGRHAAPSTAPTDTHPGVAGCFPDAVPKPFDAQRQALQTGPIPPQSMSSRLADAAPPTLGSPPRPSPGPVTPEGHGSPAPMAPTMPTQAAAAPPGVKRPRVEVASEQGYRPMGPRQRRHLVHHLGNRTGAKVTAEQHHGTRNGRAASPTHGGPYHRTATGTPGALTADQCHPPMASRTAGQQQVPMGRPTAPGP
jgi:hypothetical protein